ncbi:MAG: hypothetical protein OTI34_17130 [Lewinella sp.]|nr:hypothetical protein [Lewinella sp.]
MPDNNSLKADAFFAPFSLLAEEGDSIKVPIAGSLGLLALGDQGWYIWRQAKRTHKEDMGQRSVERSNHDAVKE